MNFYKLLHHENAGTLFGYCRFDKNVRNASAVTENDHLYTRCKYESNHFWRVGAACRALHMSYKLVGQTKNMKATPEQAMRILQDCASSSLKRPEDFSRKIEAPSYPKVTGYVQRQDDVSKKIPVEILNYGDLFSLVEYNPSPMSLEVKNNVFYMICVVSWAVPVCVLCVGYVCF